MQKWFFTADINRYDLCRCNQIIGKQPHTQTSKSVSNAVCLVLITFEPEVEMTSFKHEVPGEMVHEDMMLCDTFPLDKLRKVQRMELESTDVVVASYPKTGQ